MYLNSGLVTVKDDHWEQQDLQAVKVIMAHELGHSFGAYHDDNHYKVSCLTKDVTINNDTFLL